MWNCSLVKNLCVVLATASLLVTRVALADPTPTEDRCIAAFDRGQDDRIKHRLVSAKKEFTVCAASACPDLVKAKCLEWYDDMTKSIPTVVIGTQDDKGNDLVGIVVEIDGRAITDMKHGAAYPFDPGAHTVSASREGYKSASKGIVLKVGEQNRAVTLVLKRLGGAGVTPLPKPIVPVPGAGPVPGPVPGPAPKPTGPGDGGTNMMPMAIAGFAVAGVGAIVGGIFGGLSLSKDADITMENCPGGVCTGEFAETRSQAITFAHVSTAAFIVGGIGLGVGLLGVVLHEGDETEVSLTFAPDQLGLRARF